MFKRLKRKFILTNIITSSLVLLVAFVSIYLVAANSINHRDNRPIDFGPSSDAQQTAEPQPLVDSMNQKFNKEMDQRLAEEREASLKSLLISLIVTGITVEIIIALISLYLAEQSIKPVREAYNAQKDFVANASHEIKTPLAIIQANLEAANIKGNRWLDIAAQKTEDLTLLNNQLLALARSESTVENIELTPTSLNRLANDVISAFTLRAADKGISLKKETFIKDSDVLKTNRQALEQILNIYIDNAIKYGRKNATIEVKKDQIKVLSDGKLLSHTELKKIFGRFYQADKTTEGVGLGLSIAQALAEKNGWQVSAATSEKQKLNIFTIHLK